MFARNLLQAGDFFTCVPVGLVSTLQYNEKGNIEKIFLNHEKSSWYDVSDKMLKSVLKAKQVPLTIPVKGGTTWIRGVFYTKDLYSDSGKLPECVENSLLETYQTSPLNFEFFAGHVESLATTFRGSLPIRQWLSLAGFTCLPGFIAPMGIDEIKFAEIVKTKTPFRYPYIVSYILFTKSGDVSYPKTNISQFVAKRVNKVVDRSGYIFGAIQSQDGGSGMQVPYSTIVKYNINVNSLILRDSDGDVIDASPTDDVKRERRSNRIQCSCCGRYIQVPDSGPVKCVDSHCNSVLYPRVTSLLNTLGLPTLEYERYQEASKKIGSVFMPVDVFDLPEYESVTVTVPLTTAIRSIVPKSVLFNDAAISKLCDTCNNSPEVFIYYIQHPEKIDTDLNLNKVVFGRFIQWIKDPENVEDVKSVLESNHIQIAINKKKFDGAPIFRNKTVMITGSFLHGGLDEISSILSSYSADVVKEYGPGVDCVLVGSLNENTNAAAVRSAMKDRVPVMNETDFFKEYDIDSDLQNLK